MNDRRTTFLGLLAVFVYLFGVTVSLVDARPDAVPYTPVVSGLASCAMRIDIRAQLQDAARR